METDPKASTLDQRRQALERLRREGPPPSMPDQAAEISRQFYELQIHRIELEIQNEELLASREESKRLEELYSDFYGFAPTGFVNLDRGGTIQQINLAGATLLNEERGRLAGTLFGLFVAVRDRRAFNAFLQGVFTGQPETSCELELEITSGSRVVFVHVEATLSPDGQECRAVVADISEHRLAEQTLLASKAFADATIDAVSAHLCVLDSTGTILAVNRAWRDFHRDNQAETDSPGAFLGANYLEACDSATGPLSEHGAPMAKAIRSMIRGDLDFFAMEYPCHGPAEQRWFSARVTRFGDDSRNVVITHTNVTERKRTELRKAARNRTLTLLPGGAPLDEVLRAIVEGVETEHPDTLASVLLLDAAGTHLLLSAAPSLPEFFNLGIHGVAIGPAVGSCGTAAYTGERVVVENIQTSPLWVDYKGLAAQADLASCWSEPIRGSGGKILGTFAMYHRHVHTPMASELSCIEEAAQIAAIAIEQKRIEEAEQKLEFQLHEAQRMEALGTLAGGIAHDFNNILAAILGNASLAYEDAGDIVRTRESLDQILKAGRRAKGLVKQILAFSRRQPLELTAQPLQPLLEETAGLLKAAVPAGVRIDVVSPRSPIHARIDTTQFSQVLINLVTNAWHSLSDERGCIRLELDEVNVDGEEATGAPGRHARIRVIDDGGGMTAAVQARVFEPFFTTKAVGSGIGLGLSVVHGIVRSLGGSITVTSTVGQGSAFEVLLPAVDAPVAESSPVIAATPLLRGEGKHLLYLDDDEGMVLLVRRLLAKRGFKVSVFRVPEEALAALREDPESFDMVITDFNMPGLSGLDVAKATLELRPGLPVVITSGYISDALREGALAIGVRHLLHKADTVEEIAAMIADWVEPERTLG